MPRPRRIIQPKGYYHLYNRFLSGEVLFTSKELVDLFFKEFYTYADKYNIIVVILYCMPNHFHSIIQDCYGNLSKFIQHYGTTFARKINNFLDRSGHVFQGRHKTQLIDCEEYLLTVVGYIFNNSRRAGLVESVEDYKWSNLDDILTNLSINKNYEILKDYFDSPQQFLDWLNNLDLYFNKERYDDNKSGQFLMGDLKRIEVFKKIDRRFQQKSTSRIRRNYDKKIKLNEVKVIKEKLNLLISSDILNEWRSIEKFKDHFLWYYLREELGYNLNIIQEFFKVQKHQTISVAIKRIQRSQNKKVIVERIMLEIKDKMKVAKVAT